MSEIDRIVRLVEKTFDKQPWYGNSIAATLSNVDEKSAHIRHRETHTIIEIVLHRTSWRKFCIHRLKNDIDFEVGEDSNFPTPSTWVDAIDQLHQSQRALVEAIKQFPEDRLAELVPSKIQKYTYYTLLHGVIQHDIYHLGQIALLRKISDQ
jgi:uncharacterized damage-inducible protein DinB